MPEAAAAATSMPEWQLILLTALVTTIGTAIVSYFGHRLTVRRDSDAERERHARYLAIRVVCTLDPFASGCADVAGDDGIPTPPEGEYEAGVAIPRLVLPDDVDWRSVDPELMYRILGLPSEIAVADQSISFVGSEISSPPDHYEYFSERSIKYGRLGLTALKLADDLRKRYGIPARDYGDWNPRESLETRLAKIEKDKAEDDARRAESTRKMWEDLEARKAAAAAEPPKAS